MNAESLRDLLEHEIQDLYSAEDQNLKALLELIGFTHDPALKAALDQHVDETRQQRTRLEECARILGVEADGDKCKAMAGIIKEGEQLIEDDVDDEDVRDAAIVGAAQKVEHYEIAGYGTAATYARMLGEVDVAALLEETLDEEKATDAALTAIAEDHVNRLAMAAGD